MLHEVRELALLNLVSACVNTLITLCGQFDLRCGPISQHVVCLVQKVVQTAEVALNSQLHLITKLNLLVCQSHLLLGFLKDLAVLGHPSRLCLLSTINST